MNPLDGRPFSRRIFLVPPAALKFKAVGPRGPASFSPSTTKERSLAPTSGARYFIAVKSIFPLFPCPTCYILNLDLAWLRSRSNAQSPCSGAVGLVIGDPRGSAAALPEPSILVLSAPAAGRAFRNRDSPLGRNPKENIILTR